MSFSSIGDLSRSISLRHAATTTKSGISTHLSEATTGLKADIPAALKGDTTRLADVQTRLGALGAYRQSANEVAARAEAMQITLDSVQGMVQRLGPDVLKVGTLPSPPSLAAVTAQAASHLSDAMGQINARLGGQYLFGGTRIDTAPLPDAGELLDALRLATDGLDGIEARLAAIDAFFAAQPGDDGFADHIYRGAHAPVTTAITPGRSVALPADAASDAVRQTLKGLAILALSVEAPYADSPGTQARTLRAAGEALMIADTDLSLLRGQLGTAEGVISLAQTRNAAEDTALQLARNAMIAADPYEAATALREAEARMEAIYALTARMSRLSLAGYL